MTSHHRIDVVAGAQRPIVRKVALTETGRDRLQREATRLLRARHPGVVELLDAQEQQLELDWAGQDTLAAHRGSPIESAGIMALVATTVADLHELGIIHGRLDLSHVIVGADRRPRLCGLRGPDPGSDPTPADDVAALGELLRDLVDTHDEPASDHRRARRHEQTARRSLISLVDRATDDDPARRPTSRALAASLAEIVGDGHVAWVRSAPSTPEPPPAPEPPTAASEPDPFGLLLARLTSESSDPPEPATTAAPSVPETRPAPDDRPATGGAPLRQPREARLRPSRVIAVVALMAFVALALASHQSAGTSGTAYDEPSMATTSTVSSTTQVPYEIHGDQVVRAGVSFTAGRPGDQVQVADWNCDGTATPGLLRPSTGEVFLFEGWPDASHPETVPPITASRDVHDLLGSPPGTRCEMARIRMADGSVRALPRLGR